MLTTVARVKAELKASGTVVNDDALLLTYIAQVTRRVAAYGFDFEPFYRTEYFTADRSILSLWDGRLLLRNRKGERLLLAGGADTPTVTSDGLALVWGTDVLADPQGYTPVRCVRLNDATNALVNTWYPRKQQFIDTIVITGFWGYREYYATDGWLDSLQTVQDAGGITAAAATVTVTSTTVADSLFRTPVFSAGNLIRIENECLMVYATTGTTLSVRRGVQGTTAAAHAQGTAISVWEPEDDLTRAVTRQTALWYARRGAFEQVTVEGVATAVFPRDLEAGLYAAVQGYSNQ